MSTEPSWWAAESVETKALLLFTAAMWLLACFFGLRHWVRERRKAPEIEREPTWYSLRIRKQEGGLVLAQAVDELGNVLTETERATAKEAIAVVDAIMAARAGVSVAPERTLSDDEKTPESGIRDVDEKLAAVGEIVTIQPSESGVQEGPRVPPPPPVGGPKGAA